jgi:hypothetical protein
MKWSKDHVLTCIAVTGGSWVDILTTFITRCHEKPTKYTHPTREIFALLSFINPKSFIWMVMGSYNVATLLSSQNFVTYENLEIRIRPEIGFKFQLSLHITGNQLSDANAWTNRTSKVKYFCKLNNSTTLCEPFKERIPDLIQSLFGALSAVLWQESRDVSSAMPSARRHLRSIISPVSTQAYAMPACTVSYRLHSSWFFS